MGTGSLESHFAVADQLHSRDPTGTQIESNDVRPLRFQPGIRADGHTASLLPSAELEEALGAPNARRAIGIMPVPLPEDAPVARVTLTRSAILSARAIMFVLSGQQKRDVLEKAIADGEASTVPVGRVLANAEQPIDIHWSST